MFNKRVKVSSIINNQLPEFVRSEFPLVAEFLGQYYHSLESSGNPYDLMNNIDEYVKVDNITNIINSTNLNGDVDFFDRIIVVDSTSGFSDTFGLIQINNEIICYESKTETTFENCYRGFSGVTSYNSDSNIDELTFSSSTSDTHSDRDVVINLNSLLLSVFFNKVKKQITPGFEDREFFDSLNERLFVKQANNFYASKGTKESFRILFGAIFGKPVDVILPQEYIFEPSDADWRVTKNLVVEVIEGDPLNLLNATLYQDKTDYTESARGTITSIEKITKLNNSKINSFSESISEKSAEAIIKNYYILSLDFDYDKDIISRGTLLGEFRVHPKTKLVSDIKSDSNGIVNQSYLDVDSTLGFPSSGNLYLDLPNGSKMEVTYTSKTTNQFLGCIGINQVVNAGEEVKDDDFAYAFGNDGVQTKVRITGVISDLDTSRTHNLLNKNNIIKYKSLGKSDKDNLKLNNWILNVPSYYNLKPLTNNSILNNLTFEYFVETYDATDFSIGDKIYLVSSKTGRTGEGEIVFVGGSNKTDLNIKGQGQLDITANYTIHRIVSKLDIQGYPELSIFNSNISNTYFDVEDGSVYITTPSLPSYKNSQLKVNDLAHTISSFSKDDNDNGVTLINLNPLSIDIGFRNAYLTGDLLIVKIDNETKDQIIGYVKRINNTQIKLSQTRSNLISEKFIDFSDYVGYSSNIEFFNLNELDVTTNLYTTKTLQPQKLIRKLSDPESNGKVPAETLPGSIGIFLNGVEIQNYKSSDSIFYGKINSFDVLSEGTGYDVINPPVLNVSDSNGSGVSGECSVSGSLVRIDILDQGFNYLEVPKIIIAGGNGTNAKARASLALYDYFVDVFVNSSSVSSNSITFDKPHNFSDFEEIVYETNNLSNITGLSTNSSYFVKVVGINTIQLYPSANSIEDGSNLTISTSGNIGIQRFRSVKKKRKLESIFIENSGENYTNKKVFAYTSKSGISTFSNLIKIDNHGFNTGEIVTYTPVSDPIGGLTTSNYYVKTIDEDTFRLYEIVDEEGKNADFNLQSDQYIELTSNGGESHEFKYPDIEVSISGNLQIPTLNTDSSSFEAELQPIFRGGLKSVFLTSNGSGYGNNEIINYSKQPDISLNSGSGAELGFTINNGRITSVFITNSGSGYNSPPNIVITGDGNGAQLVPIIDSGLLIDVLIISSGGGYTKQNTTIDVINSGNGGELFANINEWNINLAKRVPSLISEFNIQNTDDGYVTVGANEIGLQYKHIYASRKIRESLNDITFDGVEISRNVHSPIIGWAYDGNPIYGPYGFTNDNGTGPIKKMVSGYEKVTSPGSQYRPENYSIGFFVNDYQFTNPINADLDIFNGRFCVTPEFPEGIYAYFATISENIDQQTKYFIPEFPYLVGNQFKSKPIQFNFDVSSNSDVIDINSTKWLRNTYPYNQTKLNGSYDYFLNSVDLKVDSTINEVSSGKIDSISIISGGQNYKVGDKIRFDSTSKAINASAIVSKLKGVTVDGISCETIAIQNIEFDKQGSLYIGYSTSPFNLTNRSIVNISSQYEEEQYKRIFIEENILRLRTGVGTIGDTGISTYINVNGNLNSNFIRENDIYKLNNEEIKVLNVDNISSRIRILRAQNGTSGLSSYSAGLALTESPRKFRTDYAISENYRNTTNRELYFNPSESVGLGTTSGVGITSTLYFSNSGVGNTFITIPTRSIYIPNHNLFTGDKITYQTNDGSPITVEYPVGVGTDLDSYSELFVAKISNDLIGITSIKVGLNSEGNYVGIETTSTIDLLYFTGIGTNSYHSFKTVYNDVLNVEVSKNTVNVSTAETHGLSLLDQISLNLNSNKTKSVQIKYSDYNRRFFTDSLEITSVDKENDILVIENNNFKLGEKVLFKEITEISGLVNNKLYLVSPINSNEFRLSESKFNLNNKIYVGINSEGSGSISRINPSISLYDYETISFNLSDESLSYETGGGSRLPAFDFKIFTDINFTEELYFGDFDEYTLVKSGDIGVSPSASVSFTSKIDTPRKLYYSLIPINSLDTPEIKKELIFDTDQIGNNEINLKQSLYSGDHTIVGIANTSFSYEIRKYPEESSYTSEDSDVVYLTKNENISGEIGEVVILNPGFGYSRLPKINVISSSGQFAELISESDSIGFIEKTSNNSIGYNYSIDNTIRPTASVPSILKLSPLYIFDSIKVVDKGFSYTSNTDLVVIDGLTNKVISDSKLTYDIDSNEVLIIKNTDGISNFTPTLIPINNSNALGINSVSYNSLDKTVTAYFSITFSDSEDFPFEIGTKILVEGFSIIPQETFGIEYVNYNSSNFDYALFEVVGTDANLGGANGSITYDVSDYVTDSKIFGTVDPNKSFPRIVPQSYFPTFETTLIRSNYFVGESIISGTSNGRVESWYPETSTLVVSTSDNFTQGQTILGETSNTKSVINSITKSESSYNISPNFISQKFWSGNQKGFLNNNLQRIHDNDYYQYFSYDLKSVVPFGEWEEIVSSTNHTAGFKKFSTTEIINVSPDEFKYPSDQNEGTVSAINNVFSTVDVDCDYNFDLASENIIENANNNVSNQVIFNSQIIQDYIKSIGNRVLTIDDLSDSFSNDPREENFSNVDSFTLNDERYLKYFITVRDVLYANESMFTIVNAIHDNSFGYVNQYADLFSLSNLGDFSVNLGFFGVASDFENGYLRFYPEKTLDNDYQISFCKFSISDLYSGISTFSLGNSVNIQSYGVTVPSGTTGLTTFVSIGSSYRSLKLHTLISNNDDKEYESFEMNIVHDGTNAYFADYSALQTSETAPFSGIGTLDVSVSGANLIVTITPNVSTAATYTINSLLIGIGDTSLTSTGTSPFNNNLLISGITSIPSSPTPSVVSISTYSSPLYPSSYHIISIEDLTNEKYHLTEVISHYNEEENTFNQLEYGTVYTSSSLGIITSGIVGSGVTAITNLYFTPEANTEYKIKTFDFLFSSPGENEIIDLNTALIDTNYGNYFGQNNDVKKQFNLTHNNLPIFERYFNATSNLVVDLEDDTIFIPNHFFTTGEEVLYTYPTTATPIGIGTTTIPGIGSTDKLPSTLYIVKISDSKVRVSGSATDALKFVPSYLDLTSVGGISTNHRFTSQKQNSKVLISIDNVIQSPVVSTGKTTLLSSDFSVLTTIMTVDDSLQVNGGDLFKIDEEIVRILVVGYDGNSNDLLTQRAQLGTVIDSHLAGTLITRVEANYNIIGNNIYFADAPYGELPEENPSNPDEIDYSGLKITSSFSGRAFLRSGVPNTDLDPYVDNYVFDSLSENFDGIQDTFTLQSNYQDVVGISTNNTITLIRSIFQLPNSPRSNPNLNLEDYTLTESVGITSITFSGSGVGADYDVNTANLPRGGIIVSVGSTAGFGYQPLVSAGGTAIVSGLGTISSISIGNSGSGYRAGIQTVVNVGVASTEDEPTIEFIGTAAISGGHIVSIAITNPGSGYTSSNPPTVVFDSPLSYSNIPLVYSSSTPQAGLGTEATVDIIVSQDTSVLSFEIKNYGYAYNKDDILTVDIGGLSGIPTDTSVSFSEFQLTIDRTYEDQFASWHLGKLTVFDPIDDLIDGTRRFFPLKIDGVQTSIEAAPGSNIDLQANLIVIVNDILQVPGESYVFDGGSVIEFIEAPQSLSDLPSGLTNVAKTKILFYEGTDGIDTKFVDILETVKVGDNVKLQSDTINLTEKSRVVNEIISSDAVRTNVYNDIGLSNDESLLREVIWCKQKDDLLLSGANFSSTGVSTSTKGFVISKARESYEPYINPSAYLIKNVSETDGEIFVDNIETFFESEDEVGIEPSDLYRTIKINSQDQLVSCAATAIVSSAGTVTTIQINNSGVGYNTTPNVYISSPIGVGITAIATASLSGSTISGISIVNGGSGYTADYPPSVLVEPPLSEFETMFNVSYEGDFGIITGIDTTSVGVASTGIVFDFYIPTNSYIRDSEINSVGIATTGVSGIQTGYYFVLRDTNVGSGLTSLDENGQIIGIGSTFIDNVYMAAAVSIAQTTVTGVGTTTIARVTVSVEDYNGLVSLGQTYYYGQYSWGRIYTLDRSSPQQFSVYNNAISGIETSPVVQRYQPLKNNLYKS